MTEEGVAATWKGELTAIRHDEETGAHYVIAVHSTRLGPAAGGTRAMVYPGAAEVVADARRLAEAMTYKMAVAGLPMGGGKSVIALPAPLARLSAATWKRILEVHAANLRLLHGSYWTGPDVGTDSDDMDTLRNMTEFAFGRSTAAGGPGSSAEETAVGVFAAVEAAAREAGLGDVTGRKVLVQGLGAVGARVAAFVCEAGARLLVADVAPDRCVSFEARGAVRVPVETVTTTECDVLVPCATGRLVTSQVAATLSCAAIAGAANNVLGDEQAADVLRGRGITYAPDFVANAGGAIHLIGREVLGWSAPEVRARSLAIGQTMERIFKEAQARGITPEAAARRMAAGMSGHPGSVLGILENQEGAGRQDPGNLLQPLEDDTAKRIVVGGPYQQHDIELAAHQRHVPDLRDRPKPLPQVSPVALTHRHGDVGRCRQPHLDGIDTRGEAGDHSVRDEPFEPRVGVGARDRYAFGQGATGQSAVGLQLTDDPLVDLVQRCVHRPAPVLKDRLANSIGYGRPIAGRMSVRWPPGRADRPFVLDFSGPEAHRWRCR